ncbi:restriction endonuclease subunit S [Shewanella algae]|uniref:restriction endonuclease subunit S n=1 Tax=Shewanella algae TaxID=38313 RepID=UPI0031F4DFA7
MLSSAWKYVPGNEYCVKVTDGTHDSPRQAEYGKPLITSKHIKGDVIDFDTAYLISEHDFNEINKRSKVDQWDVIISMIGAYCGFCFIESSEEIDYAVKNVGLFKAGSEVNAKWLYYYLNSPIGRAHLDAVKSGSTQPYIALGALRNLPILVPKKEEVKEKIVAILDAIDTKIRVNNRINAELEAMAKTLYDYWFVQFDFPDANGNPYKTSGGKMVYNPTLKREIPEGWSDDTLGEIAELYQPKTISEKEMTEDGEFLVYGANGIVGRYDQYNHEQSVVAVTCRGNSCGEINVTRPYSWITGNAMVVNTDSHFLPPTYIYNVLRSSGLENVITGSAQPQITRTNLAPMKIIRPAEKVLTNYAEFVKPSFEKRMAILDENEKLEKLRDWLLPMLMNGQVTVK